MDFINKLIKKGIFCLILVFSFFVFLENETVGAAASDCSIAINDGDKYLVLSTSSRWSDSGVTAECNGIATRNISVTVNGGNSIATSNGAEGAINSYLTKSGFYTIQYKITDQNELVYGKTFATRQIRVLPSNLNNERPLWLGETYYSNSDSDDVFNRIIELEDGYLAVGKVGSVGFVAKFDVRGEYKWGWKTDEYNLWSSSAVEITDIVKSKLSNQGIYYISGSSDGIGFVKPIKITLNVGVDDSYGDLMTFDGEVDVINRIVMEDQNIFGAGYITGDDAITTGILLSMEVDVNSGNLSSSYGKYVNVTDSRYNSIMIDSNGELVAVGNQAVVGYKGAVGGTVTKCDISSTNFSCETQEPQLYLDEELGNTIVTAFNDIAETENGYLIVGETRAAKLEGSTITFNSGVEDLLVVYGYFDLNDDFVIRDMQLRGSSSTDTLYSIKEIDSTKYVVVGKVASSAYYGFVTITDTTITVEDNYVSGNLYSIFKDVLIKNSQTNIGEIQYLFAGLTKATVLEGIITNNQGNEDSLFVILDNTSFDNYTDISVKKESSICEDGISKECSGQNVSKDYWLVYGSEKHSFIASVSTTSVKTIYTIHQFVNSQGITFKIGRTIRVVEAPTPSDIVLGEIGIEKWYVYNRKQVVGENITGYDRKDLWQQYFYPVQDGLPKESNQYYKMDYDTFVLDSDSGTTLKNYALLSPGYKLVEDGLIKEANQYYKLEGEEYVLDSDSGTTLNNYELVSVEPQATNVAFQSIEKAKEYALLQEYTRIALVKENYKDESGIIGFTGELTSLNNQNFYFVYYIDLTFDKNVTDASNKCETKNFVLVGNCDNYLGYAFSSLERISEIINVVLDKNNYFVSENNNRYNFTTNTPVTDEFKEELSTIQYLKETQFNVSDGLYLDVEFYAVDTSNAAKYAFVNTPVSLTNSLKGKSLIRFSSTGEVTGEGKYVVRYCYSDTSCGGEATFVIDRTAPVINFTADRGEEKIHGSIVTSWSKENWFKMKGDADITSISDIDPYAYTLIDGKKYYLQCNSAVDSESCDANRDKFVLQQYNYDKNDPDKIYYIAVYDRAGNKTIVNFKVATGSPTLNIPQTDSTNEFTLSIEFYNKNKIDSFEMTYTPSESCTTNCTNAPELEAKILQLIQAWNLWNQIELAKAKVTEGYEPSIRHSVDLLFSIVYDEAEGVYKGSVNLPQLEEVEIEINKIKYTGSIPVDGSVDPQPISKGLYNFSITDVFNISTSQSAGLGIEKATLDVYVNNDKWYKDEDIKNGDYKIPKTLEEYNTEDKNDGIFTAVAPNTYSKYKDIIVTETLKSAINDNMYFANQFIFVKLKQSAYGITEIRRATTVNYVGKPTSYECLVLIYGSGITNTNSLNRECTNKVLFDSLSNDSLSSLGIYVLGTDGDGKNNYYYLAFADEGVYNVKSKVEVSVTNGGILAVDVDTTFVIDYAAPTITPQGYMDTDINGNCSEGNNGNLCYVNSDFFFELNEDKNIPNIGKHDMIIDLSTEKFNGVLNTEVNRLLLVTINGEMHNAYDYSKNILEINGGEQLIFKDSGQYEIKFMDAAGNTCTIKFIIDKEAPEVGEFKDIDTDKDVNKYQQYIELEISVSEGSFLQNKNGSVMLTVNYWFDIAVEDVKDTDKNPITIQNNNGNCQIALGSILNGECNISDGKIRLSFVLAINKTEKETKITRLYIEAYDYFENGKGYAAFKDFSFDNAAPHIYYHSSYTPTTIFGESATNDDREKWISVSADSSLGDFKCKLDNFISDIITCNDMPDFGKDNDVTIEAYEAYKVASSNFYYNSGYKPLEDGTYLNPQVNVYTARYWDIRSSTELTNKIDNGVNIFYHPDSVNHYFQVTTNDQIDPNKMYYYGDNKVQVNISDIYQNYSSYLTCDNSQPSCILFNMYNTGESKFTNTNFYYVDANKYVWVKDPQTSNPLEKNYIDVTQYNKYWYAAEGTYELDTDFSDNYLKATVLQKSKVAYDGGSYIDAPTGAIKVFDDKVKYYNLIERAPTTDNSYITPITTTEFALLDTRIWRIAENEKFGFGLPSVVGRPIIFRAVDGAGNISSNQLETVIIVRDDIYPTINDVSTVSYTLERDEEGNYLGNYLKTLKYYKVGEISTLDCSKTTTTYYKDIDGTEEISCEEMIEGQDYYVAVTEYIYVQTQDKVANTEYYTKVVKSITNGSDPNNTTNYLTKDNFSVTFSEPIYRITCTYYDNKDGKTKHCDFSNTEFDYREERMSFELLHEGIDTYVNYTLTVYDFSNNQTTLNYLFIDRQAPVLEFNDEKGNLDEIEVSYSGDTATKYDESYITDIVSKSEINATDSVNTKIDELGVSGIIKNNLTYTVEYYKYNYNVTYKNYIKDGDVFKTVPDHKLKEQGTNYYILIKEPEDYILKDMDKVCEDGYCYILDEYSYYADLLDYVPQAEEVSHWELITDNKILKDKVGVYKIVYWTTDYSGNVSDKLIRTVYITDITAPILNLNDKTTTETYGYHADVKVSFTNEGEAKMIEYTCTGSSLVCQLPSHMFEPSTTSLSRNGNVSSNLSKGYTVPGVYKVYAYDKGAYVTTKLSYDGQEYDVMTLKYNYSEYQFVVDKEKPKMHINAYKDEAGLLYYEVEVSNDEVNFYCVSGQARQELTFKDYNNCMSLLSGDPKTKITYNQDNEISSIDYELVNNGKTVYMITYTKIAPNAKKFFYNTYYRKSGDEFISYKIGDAYIEENVYMVSYIKLIFREDGSYLIQAKDKAGNEAGRETSSGILEDYSRIDVDNTAPDYNKLMNQPTGINYWFSVPSTVINDYNVGYITAVVKGTSETSYNIFTSGLNNNFFYAFATRSEAVKYLTTIYKQDIESKPGGTEEFEYRYYNVSQKAMITKTFVAAGGLTAKEVAAKEVMDNVNRLVYETFSGEYLFGNNTINQLVCTGENSEICKDNNDMYKIVYLVNESGTKSIAETCTPSATKTCTIVKTKIVKYSSTAVQEYKVDGTTVKNGENVVGTINKTSGTLQIDGVNYTISQTNIVNSLGTIVGVIKDDTITIGGVLSLEIGTQNAIDTYEINVFSKSENQSTYVSTYIGAIKLKSDTYYLFEERDISITYENYYPTSGSITHYNKTYYAIFVDSEELLDVYYEQKKDTDTDATTNLLTQTYVDTNALEYYLILKQGEIKTKEDEANFLRAYEIHELWDNNKLIEVYSYLRISLDGSDGPYLNINDYLIKEGNTYYFKIPLASEHKSEVVLLDRAGNETKITVSRTRIAPSIKVEYDGSGQDLSVKLSITDTQLASTIIDHIVIEFSTDGVSYSTSATSNIRAALVCLPESQGNSYYGCSNKGPTGGVNEYVVNIVNKENLYGFFRVTIKDSHGNTNKIEFVYNPMDLYFSYESQDIKYTDSSVGQENIRMISKSGLQLKWNNQWNYIILYQLIDGERVKICDTYNFTTGTGQCGSNAQNRIDPIINIDTLQYEDSILYYLEEGIYEAEIINRASEVINNRCYNEDGELKEDCLQIKPSTTNDCTTAGINYCMEKYEVMRSDTYHVIGSMTYTKYEVDKTAPSYSLNDFVVELPSGETSFANNGQYTNAKVTIKWNEDLVRLHYTCKYVGEQNEETCVGNFSSYNVKEYTFEVINKMSTEYTFWFEDFAGNTTKNNSLTFTINIVLPEIIVYEVNSNGQDTTNIVEHNSKINTNARLRCFSDATLVSCSDTYDVKLYRAVVNGYELVTSANNTFVSENFQNTYRFVVSIKASNGYVYENLSTEIVFTIDKVAPSITVEGNKHETWGIYKGSVNVLIDADGTGVIYGGCVEIGEDEYGDKIYDCDEDNPIVDEFKHHYTLDKTGTYKVIAVDEIGNVTTGRMIKYITIDNDKPTISIKANNGYIEYEMSEGGYTNVESIIITSSDNSAHNAIMYRIKTGSNEYGEWITHNSSELTVKDEGMYEVKPVDVVGNEGLTRHFIIYRQIPTYSVFVGNSVSEDTSNQIIKENVRVSWSEPEYETEAPIVKVTVNGRPYERQSVISDTGEYVFVFVDLAGNTATHKLTINKDPNICLNNVKILPNKQYLFNISNMKVNGQEGYTFKENDVIIFATPTNYYSGISSCGENLLCYKSLGEDSYIILTAAVANYINKNKNVGINLEKEYVDKVNELGGFVYAFVVDYEVAKNDLGIKIGENFFTQDPLGWILIFAAGAGVVYVGLKLFIFRKKVRVLK